MNSTTHPDWRGIWPAIRQEVHYGDRVVPCFVDRPHGLHSLLEDAVRINGDGDALVCREERLDYRGLLDRSARIAAGLAARNVVRGERVAMLLGNCIDYVAVLFACARLGAVCVPLSTREQTPGLAYMLAHCEAKVLVHEGELAEVLPDASAVPALRCRISRGRCEGSESLEALLGSEPFEGVVRVMEDDPAVLLYTSGTTGRPKGAVLTHLGIVHSAMHYQIAMGLEASDSSIAAVPLSHVTGLVALVATMVRCACKLVIMPSFKAAEFLPLAVRERMTHTLMVPAMYNLCLLRPDFEQFDLSNWRIGAFGGAPMPLESIRRLLPRAPNLTLMNCYGATETTSPATLMPRGQAVPHIATAGLPLGCVEIRAMDSYGRELPPGEVGELWIRGPMVVPGYWNDSDASSANLTAGYWRSGDIGAVDEDGYVRVVDRMKDVINRGGYKIYSIEVENAIYTHPNVQECAVVARPCPVLGERVHAFVSVKEPGVSIEELVGVCRRLLSDYKVPDTWLLSSTPLPRNANGKLQKRQMRDQLLVHE